MSGSKQIPAARPADPSAGHLSTAQSEAFWAGPGILRLDRWEKYGKLHANCVQSFGNNQCLLEILLGFKALLTAVLIDSVWHQIGRDQKHPHLSRHSSGYMWILRLDMIGYDWIIYHQTSEETAAAYGKSGKSPDAV